MSTGTGTGTGTGMGTGTGTATTTPGPFSGTSLFTTLTPTIPANILEGILAGAIEVREQVNLSSSGKVLTVLGFTVQPSTPSPTAPSNIQATAILWNYQVDVMNISFSCKPVPSVLIVGKISQNFPATPFGDATGALVAVGFGYTTDTPPAVNNLTTLVPGIAGLYSASAVGTLSFPPPTVNPPGTTAGAPVIVFTPGATQSTASKQLMLDASQSTDPNGLQLSYVWTQVNTNIPAGIANGMSSTPFVTFGGGKGDYIFSVTVTNSAGQSSTAITTISYYGQ